LASLEYHLDRILASLKGTRFDRSIYTELRIIEVFLLTPDSNSLILRPV
jgi:hypothetical protein